jgi:membrane fusion protein
MTTELFRKEALEARRTTWLGGISLAQPLPLWVLTAAAAAAAALIGLFLVLGTYTRRSTVAGQLVPSRGLATVLAPATGVVARVAVGEHWFLECNQDGALAWLDNICDGEIADELARYFMRRMSDLEGFGERRFLAQVKSEVSNVQ